GWRAAGVGYRPPGGSGFRPRRVFWLLAALLILVILSLEAPTTQATMRATTAAGLVYGTHGPAPGSGGPGPAARLPAIAHSDACGGGQVRCFNPVLYAIHTVVPLVSLDQRATWHPHPPLPHRPVLPWSL